MPNNLSFAKTFRGGILSEGGGKRQKVYGVTPKFANNLSFTETFRVALISLAREERQKEYGVTLRNPNNLSFTVTFTNPVKSETEYKEGVIICQT
jgi:hypothetical protein